MRAFLTRAVFLWSALLVAATVSAQTQGLERVGPNSTTNGFPTWYQDKTGLTLEFCSPQNALELEGGWCLLLPADTTAPEVFPALFADEHFYFAADASTTGAINALLVIAVEAAFSTGGVVDGAQIVFARIRFRFDAPASGTYTVYHPYGTDIVTAAAGERVFVTEDVGLDCPQGTFDCALRGRIGPFLLPSNAPGGPELPAVAGPVPGKLYVADPGRLGPVTGSPVGQNFFRIEGPGGIVVQSNDFALVGRLYQGAIPGRVTINRASYSRAAGSADGKTDVFANAFATAQPRRPGQPIVGAVTPVLSFFPAACSVGAGGALGAPAGVTPVQMVSTGSRYYGQILGAIPAAVCVQDSTARDVNGQALPAFSQAAVRDTVRISEAVYNPAAGGSLTVTAKSSDQNLLPVLTASLGGALTNNADGTATVAATGIVVPPSVVTVTSAAGGRDDIEVSTLEGNPDPGNVPLPGNDAVTLAEDGGAVVISVLANDFFGGSLITDPASVVINITGNPSLGTATVNAAAGTITFTPNANANGSDFLTYTLTAGGSTSLPAFVSISITPVNDAPVAVDDAANGVGNLGISVNLLANDSDIDGDALTVANLVAPAGITFTLNGGLLSFTAPAGTHVFTYQARDAAGALSNVATVTVNLSGANETLSIIRAEYTASKRRWRVEGTSSIDGGQRVFITYQDGIFADGRPAAGTLIGSTVVAAGGLFALDFAIAGGNDPRNIANAALFLVTPTRVIATSDLGGSSAPAVIAVR